MALDLSKRKNRRPIECCLCKENQHFLVTHSRGNTLHSGGYGYVFSTVSVEDAVPEDPVINDPVGKCETKALATAHHYLFIEEVLFLFEQGMLHAYGGDTSEVSRQNPNGIRSSSQPITAKEGEEPLSRYELFQLLHLAGVSLPTYLVYQHLRAQTYRVLRHTSTRSAILVQQIAWQKQAHSVKSDEKPNDITPDEGLMVKPANENVKSSDIDRRLVADAVTPAHRPLQSLKRQLRCDTRQALPPVPGATIAWDGYHPTAAFSAATPGLPDFYVAITYMTNDDDTTHGTLSYRDIQSLLHQTIIPNAATSEAEVNNATMEEPRIPLKIATVSDSGTVLLFGITDFGVPMNHPSP